MDHHGKNNHKQATEQCPHMTAEINVFSVFVETPSMMKQMWCHLEDCSTPSSQQLII